MEEKEDEGGTKEYAEGRVVIVEIIPFIQN